MEKEIDVKEYLGVLRRRWRIVLVLFLVTVAAATAVTLLQAPVYEAQVRLMERSYTLSPGPQLQSLDERAGNPSKMYLVYVKSRAVEGRVIERQESILSPAEKVPGVLRRRVRLVTTDDPAIFDIVVTASSPDKAVQLANAWAEEYVTWVKESSQGLGGEAELVSHELSDAEQRLTAAEEALADFQRETGVSIADGNYDPSLELLGPHLSDAEQRLAAAEEALDHFQRETGIAIVSGAFDPYAQFGAKGKELEQKVLLLSSHRVARDNLSLLIRSAEEIKRTGGKISDLPLELLSLEAIANRGHLSIEQIAEQGEDIDAVIALLKAEEEIISNVTEVLSAEVTDLQAELISLDGQLTLLQGEKRDALEIYEALNKKLEELRYGRWGARGKELEQKVLLFASHRVAQDNLSLLIKSAEEIKRSGGKVSDLPLELLSVEAIANRGQLSIEQIAEQGEDIDAVIALLKAEEEIISEATEALSAEVRELGEELTFLDTQLTLLQGEKSDALSIYDASQNKLEELRIRQAMVGILAEATASQQPVGLGRTLSIGVGILFGLFVGVGGAFLLDYLQGHEAREQGG